jgi:hypothetical protein
VKNPFGDESGGSRRVNPFGDSPDSMSRPEAADRIEQAARKIRALRSQLGAEGFTFAASRELLEEVSAALEAAARALRG